MHGAPWWNKFVAFFMFRLLLLLRFSLKYLLRLNNLCWVIILIISRRYVFVRLTPLHSLSDFDRPGVYINIILLDIIMSIVMTLNNSNKVNDNEMLICQRLKLTICGRFFFRRCLLSQQQHRLQCLLFYMWCLGHKIRCNCNLYSINNSYILAA